MSWRSVQLGTSNCDQDEVILNLYKNVPVNYIGTDTEFAKKLTIDPLSKHAVAVFNKPSWLSDFINFVYDLKQYTVNRTDSENLIFLVKQALPNCNISQSGFYDNDKGQYFNFVQPLTWLYGAN